MHTRVSELEQRQAQGAAADDTTVDETSALRSLRAAASVSDLITDLLNDQADDAADKNACKTLLVALKHYTLDSSDILKIVSHIMKRFTDTRVEIRDRAAFLATALFGKDVFDAAQRCSFSEFKPLMKPGIFKAPSRPEVKRPGFIEVKNESTASDFTGENRNIYDERLNPLHIQRALRILSDGSDLPAMRAVHASFGAIIGRASERMLKLLSYKLFDQLIDLSHAELHNLQFKNFAILIKKEEALLDRTLERLRTTNSDVLKAFILYSLLELDEIAVLEQRATLHLKLAELLVDHDISFDHISKSAVMALVERGKKLLEEHLGGYS